MIIFLIIIIIIKQKRKHVFEKNEISTANNTIITINIIIIYFECKIMNIKKLYENKNFFQLFFFSIAILYFIQILYICLYDE